MYILANLLEINIELMHEQRREHFYQTPCEHKSDLELPHKKVSPCFFKFGLLQDLLIIRYLSWDNLN